jgi:hypothetical protein
MVRRMSREGDVVQATQEGDLTWATAQDNDFGTWRRLVGDEILRQRGSNVVGHSQIALISGVVDGE